MKDNTDKELNINEELIKQNKIYKEKYDLLESNFDKIDRVNSDVR
jgi:hypothetical protein